jgi:hypothetical protein
MFKAKLKDRGLNESLIVKHARQLVKQGILPLANTHKYLPAIARIMGMTWTDGSANIYNKKHGGMTGQISVNFGHPSDAVQFEDDVELMGFKRVSSIEQIRTIHGADHHTWKVGHNGALPSLLIALDVRVGKRTENPAVPVPEWVMRGSMLVKREFMAGFQGGDGCLVQINKNNIIDRFVPRCAVTSQSIDPKYKDTLISFMEQMKSLFEEFGIEMREVKMVKGKYDKLSIGYKISDKQENLIKYFERIGYRYSCQKQGESGVAVEFLKFKSNTDGHLSEYEAWKESVVIKESSIFVPIKSITEVENQLISDITVEHDNHSFIAGDNFLSSNSAMGKQAIGVYASNFRHRFDTMAHVLNYPQKPIVQTKISKIINTDEMPCGMNVIVAIMTYTGLTTC